MEIVLKACKQKKLINILKVGVITLIAACIIFIEDIAILGSLLKYYLQGNSNSDLGRNFYTGNVNFIYHNKYLSHLYCIKIKKIINCFRYFLTYLN